MLAPFFGLGGCLELLAICNREYLSLNFLYRPAGACLSLISSFPGLYPGLLMVRSYGARTCCLNIELFLIE
jgi:hypothetical protein